MYITLGLPESRLTCPKPAEADKHEKGAMCLTIDDDPVDKVDSLASPVQINLGPIVFAWRGVCVARRGSGGDTSVPKMSGLGHHDIIVQRENHYCA